MVIVNHKTNKKSQGKEKFEPKVFDCKLESFEWYFDKERYLYKDWFFHKKKIKLTFTKVQMELTRYLVQHLILKV